MDIDRHQRLRIEGDEYLLWSILEQIEIARRVKLWEDDGSPGIFQPYGLNWHRYDFGDIRIDKSDELL